MNYIENKQIWIIGASEGIGRSLALKLANAGGILILSSRNEDRLTSLQEELKGELHSIVPLDVTDELSVERAWKKIQSMGLSPDIFIYNSGCYEPMRAAEFDPKIVKKILDVNLYGVFLTLSKVIPAFIQKKNGHIVLVGSVAGYSGLPYSMGYGASKAGIINLAESLYCDLINYGIRVQLVNPGFVKTRLTDKNSFKMPSIITSDEAANHILKRIGSSSFEIRFPWLFTTFLKVLRYLPYRVYFFLLSRIS